MSERLEKPSEGLPLGDAPGETRKTADPRPHSAVLDALRGIAILGIVLNHAKVGWENSTRNPLSLPMVDTSLLDLYVDLWGPFCLALFFLLSGYLLTWTEGRRASRGNYSLRSYAFRRALRLVPAYYTALALIFLLRITDLLGGPDPTLATTFIYLAVLQSFVPIPPTVMGFDAAYWYLTSEVVFYALLPLLVLKFRSLRQRLALFGVLVATWAVIYATISSMDPDPGGGFVGLLPYYLYGLPITHLWIFVAGVLLRTLVEHLNEKRPGGSWPTLAFSLFAGSLVYMALLPHLPFLQDLWASNKVKDTTSIVSVAAIAFFVAALLGSPILSRILSWRVLGFIGVISYSFYLIHASFILLVGRHVLRSRSVRRLVAQLDGPELWLAFAGYFGFILVGVGILAYLGYRYIESPFLRYKPK